MHICYVLGQDAGGLPHYTAELANAVAKHAEVTVLKPTRTSADDVFDSAIDVREVFAPLGISIPKLLYMDIDFLEATRGILSYRNVETVREIDADVVHETSDLFPQVKLFMKLHRIDQLGPLIVTRHEVEIRRLSLARPPHLVEELMDIAIPDIHVDRTVVHTENQKAALVERGTPPDDITVIPHGAYEMFGDYDDIDDEPEPYTLLFFGNIVRHKGIGTLIRALPLIEEEIPEITLVIAGDGRIPRDVAPIIEANPDLFEVHDYFVPNERVREFFERAELVVMPYQERAGGTNGHSGVLSTAFSFGKPVITSRAGDFPSLVEGSGAGRAVPSGDPEKLAVTIVAVLRDDATRREMAANSRRLADELSWDNIAGRYLDLYHDVTETRQIPI